MISTLPWKPVWHNLSIREHIVVLNLLGKDPVIRSPLQQRALQTSQKIQTIDFIHIIVKCLDENCKLANFKPWLTGKMLKTKIEIYPSSNYLPIFLVHQKISKSRWTCRDSFFFLPPFPPKTGFSAGKENVIDLNLKREL